jgi:hypothetical protein
MTKFTFREFMAIFPTLRFKKILVFVDGLTLLFSMTVEEQTEGRSKGATIVKVAAS